MKKLLCGLVLLLLVRGALGANADDRVLAAYNAYKLGDRAKVERLLATLHGNVLESYVQYWLLKLRIEDVSPGEVGDFLTRYGGSYVAQQLRADWLKVLAEHQEWDLFNRVYSGLLEPDQELVCDSLQSRDLSGDRRALDEARPLWFNVLDLPDSCMPLMVELIGQERLSTNDIWARMRRLIAARRYGAAKRIAQYLPRGQEPSARSIEYAAAHPERYLKRLRARFAATRAGRELAIYAVVRLSRSDPRAAADHWEKLKRHYSSADRGYVYAQIAWQAALDHLPEAISWYDEAGDTPLTDEQIQWQARAALRALDWQLVRDTIERMPRKLATQEAWVYWLGRADAALGNPTAARKLYTSISGRPNFYSNLANDELGVPITMPPKAAAPSEAEIKAIADDPGIRRALALFRIDLRPQGVHEWNWDLRGLGDRALLAAAEVALRAQVFDRAIDAADKTVVQHDFSLSYLAPFRDEVEPKAAALQLDEAWVYGLMRQESRFVMDAKSSSGARGLMQLMPRTARWVARKLGIKHYRSKYADDMETNVTIGTNYLKMVMDDVGDHPVLASAAYNAGPRRARDWRDDKPLEGAIYIETIPFNETRGYVEKVMSNAVYYAELFTGKPQSLKARLGTVSARGDANPDPHLP